MTINTVTATPGRIKRCLKKMVLSPILRKKAAYIWGPPGIGKSQVVAQVAAEINYMLVDLRLTTKDSTDLTGLPNLHEETKRTIYYRPEFFPTAEEIAEAGFDGAIIFLDELSAAELRLQAASYELCLDRRIGKHKLPDNAMVIAAGNRVEDGAIAYDLTSALSDRFIHFIGKASAQDWLAWADGKVHPAVRTFIKTKPQFLVGTYDEMAENDDKINPSPRSWCDVSDIMNECENDEEILKIIIPGKVGVAAAQEYFFVTEELARLAPMDEFIKAGLSGKEKKVLDILPDRIAGLYGLSYSLPSYCESEDDFAAACFVFNVLGNVADNLPRAEIMGNAMISLFFKAAEQGDAQALMKIKRSPGYKVMRESLKSFSEIDAYKAKIEGIDEDF